MRVSTHKEVLDHGFVKLQNISGPTRRAHQQFDAHSTDPANSARMSFDAMNSNRTVEQDLKLCKYLIEHKHNTPIEMIEVWVEMAMPIFVARQFVRHRTATINEISGRYVVLPEKFYVPEIVGGKPVGGAKQGQSDTIDPEMQMHLRNTIQQSSKNAFETYQYLLSRGVAPEHARMTLPLNTYTHWLFKQDLHNMLHMLSLRMDSHAQVEAQLYAQAIFQLLRNAIPALMDIWVESRK